MIMEDNMIGQHVQATPAAVSAAPRIAEFQFYHRPVTNVKSRETMNIKDVYEYITSKNASEQTLRLRCITDANEHRTFKVENFDYVLFSGTFSVRTDVGLIRHSGLICLDFDHLGYCRDSMKERLLSDRYFDTLLLFRSPSGDGLKWVIGIDLKKCDHRTWFAALRNYIRKHYCEEIDSQCGNVSRACFLSYDPLCYVNPSVLRPTDSPLSGKADAFDPVEWAKNTESGIRFETTTDEESEIRHAVQHLVSHNKDITDGYNHWLRLGFALADKLREGGRSLYHDLSKMNAGYDYVECDKQYTCCLNGKGTGIHINTFWQMVKDAGVDISGTAPKCTKPAFASCGSPMTAFAPNPPVEYSEKTEETEAPVSTFTDLIDIDAQAEIIQRTISEMPDVETADMMTLGLITCSSSCMPNIYGIYDRYKTYPPLYAVCVAPPASSKGQLTSLREFVMPVQEEIRAANELEMIKYHEEKNRYTADSNKNDGKTFPQQPPYRSLFVPANSSSTATYQLLNDNGGSGLTFETEGDAMADALKTDYGNYSIGLRAAFHHEPICYNRRKDNEHVDIRKPRWGVFLVSYPDMIHNLVPDASNGLFSRFCFYWKTRKLEWRDVFADNAATLDDVFAELGRKFLPVYHELEKRSENQVVFTLTGGQQAEFNDFFEVLQSEQAAQIGDDIVGSVRRLGIICFRIAMVLTVLRLADTDNVKIPDTLECDNRDFHTAMTMVNQLLNHTALVYSKLLNHNTESNIGGNAKLTEQQKSLYLSLGDRFTTADYITAAGKLHIAKKTVDKWISKFINDVHIVVRISNGHYEKIKPKQKNAKESNP